MSFTPNQKANAAIKVVMFWFAVPTIFAVLMGWI